MQNARPALRAAGTRMADGDAATGRATVLVAADLGLLAISETGYGAANGGPAEVPFVAALSTAQLPSHRHRRAWETGGCPSPQNQPPGSSREGKPDKLAWEPLNPRGGLGERIDQTVCAGDGQRGYWVLSARGGWRGDDPGPGRGGHADPA